MADWLTDARQELLAAVEAALQLLGLMNDEAARGCAPEGLRADLDRLREAAVQLRDRVLSLDAEPADGRVAASEFFSHVRHDLITPVGQLIGYCELLGEELEPPWDERFRDDLAQLLGAARGIRSRIDDLLRSRTSRPPEPPRSGAAPTAVAPVSARPDRQPGRVLVVDDSELNRHLLGRWLDKHGHTAAYAVNGEDALGQLRREAFDLVLLDVVMPRLNGHETLGRMKADPELQHIPVVMISALSEFDRVARCIAIGAEDYLPKPFEPVLLEARIGACLEKKRLRDREMEHLRQIEREKKRYDELLHVVLPGEVVQELKETGTVKSRRYERVAVMFADIVGFTRFCDGHPPEEVVALLEVLVRRFEVIADRWRVQKIKTIGDSFMAVAGLLRPVDNPVENCVRCGLELLEASASVPPHWGLRIGIHAGPVVAGLLGNRHDLFDLWGDTVNTAARVEQNGTAGAITLTADAWQSIADRAEGEPLGRVEVKGKGAIELIRFGRFVG